MVSVSHIVKLALAGLVDMINSTGATYPAGVIEVAFTVRCREGETEAIVAQVGVVRVGSSQTLVMHVIPVLFWKQLVNTTQCWQKQTKNASF